MLQLAITCLIIALVAAVLGFGGLAGSFVGVAKILFFVFLVVAVLSLLGGGFRRRPFWAWRASSPLQSSVERCRIKNRAHWPDRDIRPVVRRWGRAGIRVEPEVLPYVAEQLPSIHPLANASFYLTFSICLGMATLGAVIVARFDRWEARQNELLHHQGL